MGIHGLLPQLGPGTRISLAKLSSAHFSTASRPLRLAIDISIWLFQIQSGKGGSNPALRTFYYRLLRLLSLNIHPLFVFDGPNKPLFKRNKKVGGPGVRVASVPEFLAKQLLKQFGFPWHVAPGEAEAECALLQREGVVDAVLSEDVDTLMFGSGITIRNWTAEGEGRGKKPPTHVSVYRAEETKKQSGIDREGMILVALMSGGDYIPEGIPGCGPKPACEAARAGFGQDLCALGRKDAEGLREWKERLQHEMRTNESKFFRQRKPKFEIPEDFPNREVLGYYTHPCVSTPEKLERLRREVKWDQPIDFDALRTFTADAFDWRCVGGAKKFIKNLAPALLIRELRLQGQQRDETSSQEAQGEFEKNLVRVIHSTRNHPTTDGELEYRISFTPSTLVPIDLTLEDEDDEFIPAGGDNGETTSDAESDLLPSTQTNDPESPRKRNFRPYDPDQPEKLWILKPFLQIGCPLLVEEFEAASKDPREFLKARRKAKAAGKGDEGAANIHAVKLGKARKGKGKGKDIDMPLNALIAYAKVTKAGAERSSQSTQMEADACSAPANTFMMPSTQVPKELLLAEYSSTKDIEVMNLAASSPPRRMNKKIQVTRTIDPARPFAAFASTAPEKSKRRKADPTGEVPKTPRHNNKKRSSPDLSTPAMSQRTITSYYSPSPIKPSQHIPLTVQRRNSDTINLISSPSATTPKAGRIDRPLTPTPPNTRNLFRRTSSPPVRQPDFSPGKLPGTVTKRRKKTGVLKRSQTEPVRGSDTAEDLDDTSVPLPTPASREGTPLDNCLEQTPKARTVGTVLLISSSPGKGEGELGSPGFIGVASQVVADVAPGLKEGKVLVTRTTEQFPSYAEGGGFIQPAHDSRDPCATEDPSSSFPTPPPDSDEDNELPPMVPVTKTKTITRTKSSIKPPSSNKLPQKKPPIPQPPRRSPCQAIKKKRIQLRESLEGNWKEVDTEMIDMTGDGSGWKKSGGKARLPVGWRKSGVEVLDLTGP